MNVMNVKFKFQVHKGQNSGMLTITLAVLSVPTTHVECETSVAVGDGRIVFELWPHSAPGKLQSMSAPCRRRSFTCSIISE